MISSFLIRLSHRTSTKKPVNLFFALFVALYIVVAAFIFVRKGVIVSNDSPRYITYAKDITNGIFYDDFNFWYVSYAIFLALVSLLGGNLLCAVIAQYLISFLALVSLYRTSYLLWKSNFAAFATCALFILFLEPLMWNSYILTESLYVSFICFSTYLLTLFYLGKRSLWISLTTILTIAFTFFLRPNGICLVGAIACISAIRIIHSMKFIWQKVLVVCAIGSSVIFLADIMLSNFGMIENYTKGEVIYAITTLEMRPEWKNLVVTPPLKIEKFSSSSPIIQIVAFFLQHPIYFTRLAFTKAFYFFIHIRPYWSTRHNIFSGVFLISCYMSTAFLLIKRQVSPSVVQFGLLFVSLQAVSVCLTSEDWDGRFLMPILPILFLFSGYKISSWIRNIMCDHSH